MTAPKPRAAELVEVFLRMGKAGHYTTALLEDIVFAARAEAVAPVVAVLRQLVAGLVKCNRCGAPAFSECYQYPRPSPIPYCPLCGPESGRHKLPHQDPLRAALALLAADQAGAKAGKP